MSLGQWLANQRLRGAHKLNSDQRAKLKALEVAFGSQHKSCYDKHDMLVEHSKHDDRWNNVKHSAGGAFGKWQSELKNGSYGKPLNEAQTIKL